MSEWDEDLFPDLKKEKENREAVSGSWDVLMTVFTLGATAGAAFLMTYLTKDTPSRPFWLMALCFAVPVALLMFSAWLKEKMLPSMTPNCSRNAQMILVLCSILAAAVVGCFCQVSNVEAKKTETVLVKEGWSDLLIILDKSGSMSEENRDAAATRAVKQLIRDMNDDSQVAMLIDVGWEENNEDMYIVPLEERKLDFAPLSEQRDNLLHLAEFPLYVNENFPCAFDVACKMLDQYTIEDKPPSILVISDGADCTGRFRVADYLDRLKEHNVKVFYLYVDPGYSGEMMDLAEKTGGKAIYVSNLAALTDKMQEVAKVPVYETVYRDALRDIDESSTARIVTAVLLLLLGVLIGFSLTVMFSLQGQKRAQLIISPVMALFAFLLLAFGKNLIPVPWVREGVAFTLLGVVIMRSNLLGGRKPSPINEEHISEPPTDPGSDNGRWKKDQTPVRKLNGRSSLLGRLLPFVWESCLRNIHHRRSWYAEKT